MGDAVAEILFCVQIASLGLRQMAGYFCSIVPTDSGGSGSLPGATAVTSLALPMWPPQEPTVKTVRLVGDGKRKKCQFKRKNRVGFAHSLFTVESASACSWADRRACAKPSATWGPPPGSSLPSTLLGSAGAWICWISQVQLRGRSGQNAV